MSQAKILEVIDTAGPMTAQDIAVKLQVHPSTVRHQLHALRRYAEVDFVELKKRSSRGGEIYYYLWGRPESLLR